MPYTGKFTATNETATLADRTPQMARITTFLAMAFMENMVTRCPQCKTSFRITPAQLKTARGAVRCGSCLTIFKATENLLNDATGKKEQPAATADTVKTTPPTAEIDNHDDDELINDDALEDNDDNSSIIMDELDPSMLSNTRRSTSSTSLFDRKPKPEKESPLDHSDESWAVNLLEEAEEEITGSHDAIEAPTFGSDPDEFSRESDDSHTRRNSTGTFVLIDDEGPRAPQKGSRYDQADNQSEELYDLPLPELEDSDPLSDLTSIEQPKPAAKSSADIVKNIHAISAERSAMLDNIEPDPLEMAFRIEPKLWPKRLLWAGLSILAGGALFVQWNVYNFDDLSRLQPYRSWYASACPTLGCTLPSLSAPEKISSYNLVVRSHPKIESALMVDTIILNRASFEQPFPNLILTFSDRDHKPLARRHFTPAEYLHGELAGRRQMPSGQPIHIALELADPGHNAVNYSAAIEANPAEQ